MLLFPVATALTRLNFSSEVEDAEASVTRALHSATRELEGLLRTKLDRAASVVDNFRLVQPVSHGTLRTTRMALRRGLVATSPAVTVWVADSYQNLADSTVRDDLRAYGSSNEGYVLTDYDRGVVQIVDLDLTGKWCRVTYDAGLYEDSDELAEDAPDWLAEAAFLVASRTVDADPALREKDDSRSQKDSLRRQLTDLITPYIRYEPGALRPLIR